MKPPFLIESITVLLAILFSYTAATKLIHYKDFVGQAHQFGFSHSLLMLIWVIPVMELITAILLIFYKTKLYGLYLSTALMSIFTCFVAYILFTSKHLPCACGGMIKQMSWKQHLVFNVLFLAIALTGVLLEKEKKLTTFSFPEENIT